MLTIRLAAAEDTALLRDIYAQYMDTPITFELEVPSLQEYRRRIEGITKTYPYLVAEWNDRIVGYAYAHSFRERQAYRWGAELSVYIDRQHQGKGIGTELYKKLIRILKLQNIKIVYAGVTLPNEKSEGLHRSLGFDTVGVYHQTGYKCGKWHDVKWFEKFIGDFTGEPADILPITQLDSGIVEALLKIPDDTVR